MTTQAKAGKPANKPKTSRAKKAKACEAPRPTRTKAAIATAQGPARSYLFSEAIGEEICRRLAAGESLRSICRSEGMPDISTVLKWALDRAHPFARRYAQAREIGYRILAEEILEISDNSRGDFVGRPGKDGETVMVIDHEAVARARLRVDSRKWMLAKMLPKIFGEKIVSEITGKDGGPIEIQPASANS